ncbi:MAG: type VI secretion system tip protein TssI/VgrG [Pseudomonadota bacterium]
MNPSEKKFEFLSNGFPGETFYVFDLKGMERLSEPYQLEMRLASRRRDIDLDALSAAPAVFGLIHPGGKYSFPGLVAECEVLESSHGWTFYNVILVPEFWKLKLTRHNQVFLDVEFPDLISSALMDGGLSPVDFEINTTRDYPLREYVCQYGESHFDFVSRWMEREGVHYFFEQGETSTQLKIVDSSQAHQKSSPEADLILTPVTGLKNTVESNLAWEFWAGRRPGARSIRLKDYNYRRPSLEISAEVEADPEGFGTVFHYGDHIQSQEEGRALARLRAEGQLTEKSVFHGRSLAPFLKPGYLFTLQEHPIDEFNIDYLAVEVAHEGRQAAYLYSLLGLESEFAEKEDFYHNRFQAIPAHVQYRPQRKTRRPRIHGCLNARIDAAGSGQYAELDHQGRYKVRTPFDLGGRGGGKASPWIRMAQPYAGPNYGFHSPLHKGCEVLLTFIDGNPDRPLILGAVANPASPTPIVSATSVKAAWKTAGNNKLEINDEEGNERVLLYSPQKETWFRLGAPNDPGSKKEPTHGWWGDTEHDFKGYAGKTETKVGRNQTELVIGGFEEITGGGEVKVTVLADSVFALGGRTQIELPKSWEANLGEILFGMKRVEAVQTQIQLANQVVAALQSKQQVINQQTKVFKNSVEAINSRAQALQSETLLADNDVFVCENEIRAKTNSVQVAKQVIRQAETNITYTTMDLTEIQRNIQTMDACVLDAGTAVTNLTSIKNQIGDVRQLQAGTIIFMED